MADNTVDIRRAIAVLILLCVVAASLPSGQPISGRQAETVYRPLAPNAYAVTENLTRPRLVSPIPRIAVVKPIFTATAYYSAFYVFYAKYASSEQPFITSDLRYLNVTVKFGWGWSNQLESFMLSYKAKQLGLVLGETFTFIDEINVTEGGLFRNGKRVYDIAILGFTEYVTREEYDAYRTFVASGGTLVIMDACNFLAEVKYYPPLSSNQSGYLSLVKGHGWEFNGTCAWKSVYHRWWDENRNWVGSNYWRYWTGRHYDSFIANTTHPISVYLRQTYGTRIPSFYVGHEENTLQNFTNTKIIGYWNLINSSEYPGQPIVAYQHYYGNGTVFHSGVMASDVIASDHFMQDFLLSIVGTFPGTQTTAPWRIAAICGLSAAVLVILFLSFSIAPRNKTQRRTPRRRRG